MSDERNKKGQQPEALRSLEAAAEHGSRKPVDQGLTATEETAPRDDSLEQEEETAANILKAAAEKDTAKAAKKAPPR
jgi:hypothetical protein